jgi:hypothetical protein
VPRDDLSEQARTELEALERILVRAPVGEEHLELAALVDSVRANAPLMDRAFAERLDAEVGQRLARRRRLPRVRFRGLALAGGGLLAAAVAFAIVLSGGLLAGGEHRPAKASTLHSPAGSAAFAATPVLPAPTTPRVAAPSFGVTTRLVTHSSTLVLASAAPHLSRVANEVVAQSERSNGVVASSYVYLAGAASRASFTLRVPAAALPSLLRALSTLASVRSLTQQTTDVTSGYQRALATLAALTAKRAALEPAGTVAARTPRAAAVAARLHALEDAIAAQRAVARQLLAQDETSTLQVRLVVAASRTRAAGAAAGSAH